MTEYDNELRGVLFANTDKKSEKAPDLTGTAQIEGEEYRLAAWKRVSANSGKKFYSIAFESKADFDARMKEILDESDDSLDL